MQSKTLYWSQLFRRIPSYRLNGETLQCPAVCMRGPRKQDDARFKRPFRNSKVILADQSAKTTPSSETKWYKTYVQWYNLAIFVKIKVVRFSIKNIKKYKYLLIYILLENARPYDTYAQCFISNLGVDSIIYTYCVCHVSGIAVVVVLIADQWQVKRDLSTFLHILWFIQHLFLRFTVVVIAVCLVAVIC